MKYGIVGNRKGWSWNFVREKLNDLRIGAWDTIISGGADGIDTYAQNYAKLIGAKMIILYPNPKKASPQRYFDRNKNIAEDCDILIAFDKGSSSGSGTLNTINHIKRMKKEVIIIKDMK